MKCPVCGVDVPEGKRFCASCGADARSDGPTLSRPDNGAAAGAAPARASDLAAAQPARFLPGMMIAERYRIVAQIGRGGMGEVYRADDLRLGQTVALKFLPESLTKDSAALTRLNREVRTARQVSHPNVCRVFDIGEADQVPFITMEFVDGEDLASLLRRIGRLQPAKALQLAHQLCAGLAEIHAFGILHRDLKPANIMLDGRGNLRITDFGLAVVAQEIPGEEAHAGTPAYMAPEQLAGEKPTQQSDIYALGLILYELFTGKPAFESLRTRTSTSPKPSSVAKDVDAVIERAILRCLEKEPAARPRTATMVAAAFPGGDPLAAAIAAGETPSPEMVAAAIDEPAISLRNAWILLAVFFGALAGVLFLTRYATLDGMAPPGKAPEALVENAQQIINRLGYTAPPVDSAYWVTDNTNYLQYVSTHEDSRQWLRKLRQDSPPFRTLFWYRQSPHVLETYTGRVNFLHPAPLVPGMVATVLDERGHLGLFVAVPPQLEESRPNWPEPDWGALFEAAGLSQSAFTPVTPKWQPPLAFDKQAAWEGNDRGYPVHIMAAAFHGRPVYFEVIQPWDRPVRMVPEIADVRNQVAMTVVVALLVVLWVGGAVLARRNWRQGRGDRKIAMRLGACIFVVLTLEWVVGSHHTMSTLEYARFAANGTGEALHYALLAGVLYLALEPLVRRRWPNYLVCWTRAFSGHLQNPRVGRDVLVGACFAVVISLTAFLSQLLPYAFNVQGAMPFGQGLFQGPFSYFLVGIADAAMSGVFVPVMTVAALLLLTLLVRDERVALVLMAFLMIFLGPAIGNIWIAIVLRLIWAVALLYLLRRFGLLAMVAEIVVNRVPILPLDPSRWSFGRAVLVLLIVASVAVWAFRTALAGRPAFGGVTLEG